MPNESHIYELIAQLGATSPVERARAAVELVKSGGRAVPALIDALKYGPRPVQVWSGRILGEIGDPRALQPLQAAAEQAGDDEMRSTLREALDKLSPPGSSAQTPDPQTGSITVRAIYERGYLRLVHPLDLPDGQQVLVHVQPLRPGDPGTP